MRTTRLAPFPFPANFPMAVPLQLDWLGREWGAKAYYHTLLVPIQSPTAGLSNFVGVPHYLKQHLR
jgi:hypothetical protein